MANNNELLIFDEKKSEISFDRKSLTEEQINRLNYIVSSLFYITKSGCLMELAQIHDLMKNLEFVDALIIPEK
jgi:hypothetical protein